MKLRTRGLWRRNLPLPFAFLVCLAGGCGKGKGEVVGKVTYKDKPVVYGTIIVIASNNRPHYGPIEKDGTFKISGVVVGPAKVAVASPNPAEEYKQLKGMQKTEAAANSLKAPDPNVVKEWFRIPHEKQYLSPESSGLTLDVQKGENPFNIVLK